MGLVCCPVCRRLERPFEQAVAYGSYDGGLRELVHLLKYNGVRPAAGVLGRMLAEAIAALTPLLGRPTVIRDSCSAVQGPAPPARIQPGGADFKGGAEASSRERFELRTDILERMRDTHSQIGLTSHQRRENMRGAFAVSRSAEIADRPVLLVDDVYTTGSTATECAKVLRRAGAAQVWVATVARTLKMASNQGSLKVLGFQGREFQGPEDRGEPAATEAESLETIKH